MPNQRLIELADALDEQALAWEYIAGYIRNENHDEAEAKRVEGEARTMRNHADFNRVKYVAEADAEG